MTRGWIVRLASAIAALALAATPAWAQQTGSITGQITAADGSALPGVTVEARADVLPSPRVATTDAEGRYRLPALPPGAYTIKFTLSGMQPATRRVDVQLNEERTVDATLSLSGVSETVNVSAEAPILNRDAPTITSGLTNEQILGLPVGQEYRDLIKLIPGVQYTQDLTRGPSAGGSGQDNVYNFDGVNVTLPLFGTLSAEPAAHDIAQITTTKGGARALDFDRSGGFSVDSVSKSGTNRLAGGVSFQFQTHGMAEPLKTGQISRYEQDRTWTDLNAGGPVLRDKLFFYASYYRPGVDRQNASNKYGTLPDYRSTRNEGFGKLTYTPGQSLLFNVSYRDSHRLDRGDTFGGTTAPTAGTGNEAWLRIGTADGSWLIDAQSYVTFKYTHFTNLGQGRPDSISPAQISTTIGTHLDLTALDTLGLFTVPKPASNQPAFNAFIQPLIDRYGYVDGGVRTGGGTVGFGSQFDKDDFFRDAGQIGYNRTFGGRISHDVHVGYQQYVDAEEFARSSNGWGTITVPGGLTSFQGTPIFFTATFQQQTIGAVPTIRSEYHSQSVEVNDTIRLPRWTFNVGVLASRDVLYGQGLQNDDSTLSGFVLATGKTSKDRRYRMYTIPFSRMIQPRLGATWAYGASGTVFASFATYNPAASSLPRAASWDRNLAATINAHFDANGVLFGVTNVASSSGKLFVPDMTPKTIREVLFGTSRQISRNLSGRIYGRYREGHHFWEDTNNDARTRFDPPAGIPRELYIPDLTARRVQIGNGTANGSTYVITELDGAYTKYYEATLEAEWRTAKTFVHGSYTYSHYYGNFDQDETTTVNDANVFIGSSFIGDDAGRQLWNFRDGTLRGDRPHMLKIYGYRSLPWNATAGAFVIAQSGQPWETWSYLPYVAFTTSTSDSSRYAEPAGSRRSPGHAQVDLNYTQSVPFGGRYRAQAVVDLFNIGNSQTGYNFTNALSSATYGLPRNYWDPRRVQVSFRLAF